MFPLQMTLPSYHMVGGESKNITIPIYDRTGRQLDATGITARFAICDYVNIGMVPYAMKDCRVIPSEESPAVLFVALEPADTMNLYGKFIYQISGLDFESDLGVMRGLLTIAPNRDRAAISMEGVN